MGYFTELIDRIWDEKPKWWMGGRGSYTIPQMLSILVLVLAIFLLLSVISGIIVAGEFVLNLIKGFFVADG